MTPRSVSIREVGPRDGLQPEAPVAVADRVRLVEALVDAGVRHVEAGAFVSPAAVPAMAGTAEVLAGLARRPGVTYAALVPNRRGAELALAATVDEVTVTVSVSEAYSRRNVGMSVDESVAAVGEICLVAAAGVVPVPVDAVVSCAFGSPYEGDVAPDEVARLGGRLRAAGVARLTLADTTGMATPRRLAAVVDVVGRDVGLHLHDSRGTALVNAWVALGLGVERFDTAVGGLGGSPFAPGAGGNLATEDLVYLLEQEGFDTGIDLDRLLHVTTMVAAMVGRPVPSRVAAAGPRLAGARPA